MSVDGFIPQLVAGSILKNLNDAHVYAQGFNRDYEGQLKAMGDSVKITSIGRVTIRTYTKNSTITAPETMQDSSQILVVDQGNYFNVALDDVDKMQSSVELMSSFGEEAAWGLADTTDDYLAAALAANVAAANVLTAVNVGTGAGDSDLYETIVDLGVRMDQNNAPSNGRWAVISPAHRGLLKKDPRFVSFGTDANVKILRGAPIGMVDSMTIRVSNNVPSSGTNIIAGVMAGQTFAEQIDKTEAFRPQDRFADAVKGLHIYGCKITRPYTLASVLATVV